ncbi:unnamed protein product [Protopolystoma xenopodis]|uniref:Uncharacterized protein n=1 Tax=Protopolystoma xenopodis TaxID=117903 RepID=A0A3S5A312_9PLAT|nr:unnamed protein product [Protopolystoma xenopodis]
MQRVFSAECTGIVIKYMFVGGPSVSFSTSEVAKLVSRLRPRVQFRRMPVNSVGDRVPNRNYALVIQPLTIAFQFNSHLAIEWIRDISMFCSSPLDPSNYNQLSSSDLLQIFHQAVQDFLVLIIIHSTFSTTNFISSDDISVGGSGAPPRCLRLHREVVSAARRLVGHGYLPIGTSNISLSDSERHARCWLSEHFDLLLGEPKMFDSMMIIADHLMSSAPASKGHRLQHTAGLWLYTG